MNSEDMPDDVSKKFELTREKIKEIESKAVNKLRHPASQVPQCSFCNRSSDEVGGLCQSEIGISICLGCAKAVVDMLEGHSDAE